MGDLFLHVLEISIMVSFLILAVLLIRACFKKMSSSFKCFLWLLVGIRLLVPVTISSPFGLVPHVELTQEQETAGQINVQEQQGFSQVVDNQYTDVPQSGIQYSEVQNAQMQYAGNAGSATENWKDQDKMNNFGQIGVEQPVAESSGNGNLLDKVLPVVTVCWIGGTILMLAYMMLGWLRLHRSLCQAIPEMIELGGMQMKIYRTENHKAPFLLGISSPKIYLPYGMDDKELEYVLAHEMMHIRRKDYLLKPISFIVLALYWFHPLVWLAYLLLGKDIEMACDEQVLRENASLDRIGYARALLACSSRSRKFYVCPVAFGESDVKMRVKNVLNYKKPGFWVVLVCAILCVLVALCFMTVSDKDADGDAMTTDGEVMQEDNSGSDDTVVSEPTGEPTVEPVATPTVSPAATPDSVATPVPTVVPENYVPGMIAGFTEEQSKQIREELYTRLKYEVRDNHSMLVWLDNEEYVPGDSLGSMGLNVFSGMNFVALDTANYVDGLEMDGQKWVAVTLMPHVEKEDEVFPYAERAMEIMIPVSMQEDGSVVLGTYFPKRYSTGLAGSGYMMDSYEEENFTRAQIHLMQADVTHDGIPDNIETFIYLPPEADLTQDIGILVAQQIGVDNVLVQVYDGSTATEESLGTPIFCSGYSTCHAGNGALSVVHRDGKDYLVESSTWSGQGAYDYRFTVLTLDVMGHQYIMDYEEMHWDSRKEEDTQESLKQEMADFRDRLTSWIEDGEIVIATDVMVGHMITTEKLQVESGWFYNRILK